MMDQFKIILKAASNMFLQKDNLNLAFKTGESVGITATLVRPLMFTNINYIDSILLF